jgi:hypothetical protein
MRAKYAEVVGFSGTTFFIVATERTLHKEWPLRVVRRRRRNFPAQGAIMGKEATYDD